MKNRQYHPKLYFTAFISTILLVSAYFMVVKWNAELSHSPVDKKIKVELEEKESKKQRGEYFFKLLRDPEINRIPANIRNRELEFANNLSLNSRFKGANDAFEWQQAGPDGIGGRTRALGFDERNSDIIIAGGVSGGIWKSTNGGNSWQFKSDPDQSLSVTSIDQDPTNPDTWYYAAGEITGGSTTGIGGGAFLFGTGIFRSTDNGETWQVLPSTIDTDDGFSGPFDFVSRIRVNPQTGTVFTSSNGFGIVRSKSGDFSDAEVVLGNPGGHLFTDIKIADNGRLVASISANSAGAPPENTPGIYISSDDGDTWNNITPASFPENFQRTVLAIAPSEPSIIYAFTHVEGRRVDQVNDLRKFTVTATDTTSVDLSDNIPNAGGQVGFANVQGSYNMDIVVKPDDPDFVLMATINLFRSRDGFSTSFSDADGNGFVDNSELSKFWVGGYDPEDHANNSLGQYPQQHPDQHIVKFDPSDPDKVWVGHDGGISVTENITATASSGEFRAVEWQLMNTNYLVTQFYDIAIPNSSGDNRIMGGTQDNGTPFFQEGLDLIPPRDISSGDGAFSFFTPNFIYVSTQNGSVVQLATSGGDPNSNSRTGVTPPDASGQLFIHPYLVDHNNEDIMYYPGGDTLWKNTQMSNFSSDNWQVLDEATLTGQLNYTALDVSTTPANILYLGASPSNPDSLPKIIKIENANAISPNSRQDITPAEIDTGSFIHDIHVNPANGNEVMVVVSNFGVESLFHTSDGGTNWSSIEGDLGSTSSQAGPSFRSAVIANVDAEKVYVVGTSIGVFSTQNLDGSNTAWQKESEDLMGNVIVNAMDYRRSDQKIALGTHGRGVFTGNLTLSTPIEDEQFTEVPGSFKLEQNFPNPFNPSTSIQFSLPTQSVVKLTVYDVQGKEVRTLISNETRTAGAHSFNFNAEGLASGVYFYRIQAESVSGTRTFTETRKLTLIK